MPDARRARYVESLDLTPYDAGWLADDPDIAEFYDAVVAVSDNGPGIPEDQRQVVFNVFESSKGSRGTGIGLPVSRKIIREHGGRIRIEGGPGEGTRFILSWPRGNPKSETVRLESPTETGGL